MHQGTDPQRHRRLSGTGSTHARCYRPPPTTLFPPGSTVHRCRVENTHKRCSKTDPNFGDPRACLHRDHLATLRTFLQSVPTRDALSVPLEESATPTAASFLRSALVFRSSRVMP